MRTLLSALAVAAVIGILANPPTLIALARAVTKIGTVTCGVAPPSVIAGIPSSYDRARAEDVDPGGSYKAYPDWARYALSPKGNR